MKQNKEKQHFWEFWVEKWSNGTNLLHKLWTYVHVVPLPRLKKQNDVKIQGIQEEHRKISQKSKQKQKADVLLPPFSFRKKKHDNYKMLPYKLG